jgi:hypothetical protein
MPVLKVLSVSILLFAFTGCATSNNPSSTNSEAINKGSVGKSTKHDERKAMDEESRNSIQNH